MMFQKPAPRYFGPLEVLACGLYIIPGTLFFASISHAQIVPDGTTDTSIEENAGEVLIRDGERRGDAVFHSFSRFDIEEDGQATFDPGNGVSDIFTRVTGNSESSIRGELGVLGDTNLYLINSNGITFGPRSRLDIDGSFTATTASSVVFQDGSTFSTSNSQIPSVPFTVASPLTLEFRESPGPITIQTGGLTETSVFGAELSVSPDNSIALIGGNIFIESFSQISAPGGLDIGSYDLGSSVRITTNTNGSSTTDSDSIDLLDININGPNTIIISNQINPSGIPGFLSFNGRNIRMQEADLSTFLQGTGISGDIVFSASNSINLFNLLLNTGATSNGSGGNVIIEAKNLEILGPETRILTNVFGDGKSGNVFLNADNNINISSPTAERQIEISVSSSNSMNVNTSSGTGNIALRSGSLSLNNALLRAVSNGSEGNLVFEIQEDLILNSESQISARAIGNAPGGNIEITTENLIALDNSDIVANAVNNSGGNITINAEGIFGTEVRDPLTSESDINASSALGPQFDGVIELNTPDLDPSDNLEELPEEVIDPRSLVSASPCPEGVESEFVIEGSGALPSSPGNTLAPEGIIPANLAEPVEVPSSELESSLPPSNAPSEPVSLSAEITPAWGWVWNDNGEVLLTAYNPETLVFQRVPTYSGTCSAQ